MEEDIKVLEDMRDEIYGAMDFEDDYQVRNFEQKQFDALNLAIKHLRKTRLVHSQFIPKSKVREKIEEAEEYEKEVKIIITVNGIYYIPSSAYYKIIQEGYKELL